MAYYTPSGLPANQTREISAQIRNEYALLAAGFNMLPLPAFLWGGAANFATDTGAANAYVVTNGSAYVTGYYDGLTLNIRALAANTGASTLNLNGLGLKAIVRADGADLQAGDIGTGQVVGLIYSTALGKFVLSINPLAAINAATSASASASAASASAAAAAGSASAADASAIAAAASAAIVAVSNIVTLTGTETLTNKTHTLPVINGYTEGTTVANSTTAYTFSLASSTVFLITLTGNVTYTFPTAAAGKSFTLYQLQDGTGSRTATWPGTVKWPAGTAPTITATASKADKFIFTCFDGTNWAGSLAGSAY